jgi:Protein of unknown function (DUF2934)
MYLQNKIIGQMELQDTDLDADAVSEAWRIEQLLNRAHEIHRAHGGLFGYDLEDWLQAEREFVETNRSDGVIQDRCLQDRSHDAPIDSNGRASGCGSEWTA